MAMELLEGVDLKQAIGQGRLKGLDDKLEIMSQICDGLAFAHANDIVHRDLKPANLFLLPDGQVKIMDFGLARVSGVRHDPYRHGRWERPITCRPSRCEANTWTSGPTSSPSAACSTRS